MAKKKSADILEKLEELKPRVPTSTRLKIPGPSAETGTEKSVPPQADFTALMREHMISIEKLRGLILEDSSQIQGAALQSWKSIFDLLADMMMANFRFMMAVILKKNR
jgi:hypothetical protein